tara:strand:- start:3638 stop:5308 length:1671 start_codon:yes stop_codon:yes gene_type:complete
MPYIGNDIRSNEDYKIIDDISSGFNGNATSFALQVKGSAPVPFPKFESQLLISINGVIQEPDPSGSAGFRLSGTNIVFSSAPTGGHAFFGVIYAGADYVNAGGTFPDGTSQVPSISFTTDTDTGLFRSGSGLISIVSNGTKVATFPTNQGVSGQALVTDGAGVLSYSSPSSTGITVSDESSDTTCFPLFVTTATGSNLPPKSGSNLAFNSSSGLLTATAFSGSGASLTSLNASNISSGTINASRIPTLNQNTTGSAATLTTARNIGGVSFDGSANINLPGVNTSGNQNTSGTAAVATTVTVADESSDTLCFPLFATTATGNLAPKTGSNLAFNSANGTLTATLFSGSGASLTALPAGQLTGTVADARISTLTASKLTGALPVISGTNLTNLDASNLASGTIPDARFPATLPTASGENLTDLDASNLASGTMPAARLPNHSAALLTSGTIPDARFPATLPTASGENLTDLDASNLASGTIPNARFPATLPAIDGSNLTGVTGRATGGGSDQVFYENDQTITTNYTITNNRNAGSFGPITINSGVTVTIGAGENYTIV